MSFKIPQAEVEAYERVLALRQARDQQALRLVCADQELTEALLQHWKLAAQRAYITPEPTIEDSYALAAGPESEVKP